MINKIESNNRITIGTVVSEYANYVKDGREVTDKKITQLRNILYDVDNLAYDILSGHYNIDIAIPILTGFNAKIEGAISSTTKEKEIIIRKSMPYYTYLSIKHGIPYLDKKIDDLQIINNELEKVNWGFNIPPYSENINVPSNTSTKVNVSLAEFSKNINQELTFHGVGEKGIEIAIFNGMNVISVILKDG